MRSPTWGTSLLWGLVVLLLAGTVAVSLTVSSLTGRDPSLGILALAGAVVMMVALALWLERPLPTTQPREYVLPEAAWQELIRILRDSPFANLQTQPELLYGTPPEFQASLPRSDTPAINLSALVHHAAQHDPPILRQILDNATNFMGQDHPRTRDIVRWRKLWSI